IVDAVMAAVATPGLVAPLRSGDRLLAEATLVDSVPLAALPTDPAPRRVVGVLAGPPLDGGPSRRYATWRAVAARAVEVKLAQDARRAIESPAEAARWSGDAAALAAELAALAAGDGAGDGELAVRLDAALDPLRVPVPPSFTWISPS